MSTRLNTLVLAVAGALSSFAVQASDIPFSARFGLVGDNYVNVEPATVGKTRADVMAELAAWRKNPVSSDGWEDLGEGLRYVGNARAKQADPAKADMRLAAGVGFKLDASTAQAESVPVNELPVSQRFGQH